MDSIERLIHDVRHGQACRFIRAADRDAAAVKWSSVKECAADHIGVLDDLIDGEDPAEDGLAAALVPVRDFLASFGESK